MTGPASGCVCSLCFPSQSPTNRKFRQSLSNLPLSLLTVEMGTLVDVFLHRAQAQLAQRVGLLVERLAVDDLRRVAHAHAGQAPVVRRAASDAVVCQHVGMTTVLRQPALHVVEKTSKSCSIKDSLVRSCAKARKFSQSTGNQP